MVAMSIVSDVRSFPQAGPVRGFVIDALIFDKCTWDGKETLQALIGMGEVGGVGCCVE